MSVHQARVEGHMVGPCHVLECRGFLQTQIPKPEVSVSTHSFQFPFKKTEKEKATVSTNIIYRKQRHLK